MGTLGAKQKLFPLLFWGYWRYGSESLRLLGPSGARCWSVVRNSRARLRGISGPVSQRLTGLTPDPSFQRQKLRLWKWNICTARTPTWPCAVGSSRPLAERPQTQAEAGQGPGAKQERTRHALHSWVTDNSSCFWFSKPSSLPPAPGVMCVCMCVHVDTCLYMSVVCTCVCMYVCTWCVYVCGMYMSVSMYMCLHMYACAHMCVCVVCAV